MEVYGLTGGIGSGKSTVAALLEEYGVPVVSADELSRIVVAPGSEGLREVVAAFGSEVLDDRGELDRARMASIVFGDAEKRRRLEEILHPRIRESFEQVLDALEKGGHEVAIYEVPLLFEKNLQGEMKAVILVTAPDNIRVARVRARDDVTETEVRARMAAQMDEASKRRRADYVIENDGTQDDLRREVEFLLARFLRVGGIVHRVPGSEEDAAPIEIVENDLHLAMGEGAPFPTISAPAPSRRPTEIPIASPPLAVRTGQTVPPGIVSHAPQVIVPPPLPASSAATIAAPPLIEETTSSTAATLPLPSSSPTMPAAGPQDPNAAARTIPAPSRAPATVNQPPSAPPLRRPDRATTGGASPRPATTGPRPVAPRPATIPPPSPSLGAPTPPPPPTRPPTAMPPPSATPGPPVVVVPPPPPRTRTAPLKTAAGSDRAATDATMPAPSRTDSDGDPEAS